jgi:LemA protein
MFPSFLAIAIGAIVVALFVIAVYNGLVSKRQEVQEAWSAIETELRRRFDLIPNLVETVKGYAGHEQTTLTDVIKARNAAVTSGPIDQQVASQNAIGAALGRLMVLTESYPELKANQNFIQLQDQLNETETRISQSRRFYNAVVKEYNTMCQSFPSVLIANSFGFQSRPYFGIDNADAFEPVKINFSSPSQNADAGATIKVPERQSEER